MPSLIRFLVVVGVLGAVVYGGLYAMAVFFEPEPKETSTTGAGRQDTSLAGGSDPPMIHP